MHAKVAIWRYFQYDIFNNSYFNISYRRCMPRTLALRPAGLDHACQGSNMAILLTSLLFVFEISFLSIPCQLFMIILYQVVLWDVM